MAFIVLAVEAYLLHEYYGRYYGRSVTSDTAVGGVTVLDGNPGSSTPEDTAARTRDAVENTGSGEPGPEVSFVHRASDENSRGDYSYLSDPSIDGDPNAVVLVAPSPNLGDTRGSAYEHNIGVWYEFVDRKKWAIFNQDRAAVPAGTAFAVALPQASEGFVHQAGSANTAGSSTYLDDPLTNDKPNLTVAATQNWNPGGGKGIYNDHPVGVRYDEEASKWTVYNKDDARMPDGAAFNIAVSRAAETAR